MRPIHQLTLTRSAFPHEIYAVLMNYLGEYCSVCERPLPAEAWVWDERTEQTLQRQAFEDDWPHLLLLCHNCYQAQELEPRPTQLLLPHEETTFRISDNQSPFVYELRPVTMVYLEAEDPQLDEESKLELERQLEPEKEYAIVRGTTFAAESTIEYFALNTEYYHPATNSFHIPMADYLAAVDRRLDQRTRVWQSAIDLARRINDARNVPGFEAMVQQAALAVAAAGYWSTWATLLWNELQDRTLLERILLPPTPAADNVVNVPGPGPHQIFPGTRRDWLD